MADTNLTGLGYGAGQPFWFLQTGHTTHCFSPIQTQPTSSQAVQPNLGAGCESGLSALGGSISGSCCTGKASFLTAIRMREA